MSVYSTVDVQSLPYRAPTCKVSIFIRARQDMCTHYERHHRTGVHHTHIIKSSISKNSVQ